MQSVINNYRLNTTKTALTKAQLIIQKFYPKTSCKDQPLGKTERNTKKTRTCNCNKKVPTNSTIIPKNNVPTSRKSDAFRNCWQQEQTSQY